MACVTLEGPTLLQRQQMVGSSHARCLYHQSCCDAADRGTAGGILAARRGVQIHSKEKV